YLPSKTEFLDPFAAAAVGRSILGQPPSMRSVKLLFYLQFSAFLPPFLRRVLGSLRLISYWKRLLLFWSFFHLPLMDYGQKSE
ncbi:MAG: hypothetical protein ACPG5T_05720, partial [Endozoicomonas sp.]